MRVTRILDYDETHPGYFSIFVLSPHDLFWGENPFSFKHIDDKVFFLVGGYEKDKKFVGQDCVKEKRVDLAVKYLEEWLKECKSIGRLQSGFNLRVLLDDTKGADYFSLQVWAWDQNGYRHHIPFRFCYENDNLYYLGYNNNTTKEVVFFVYEDKKSKMKKTLGVSPRNKEEAIYDAVDYLEWRLTNERFKIKI